MIDYRWPQSWIQFGGFVGKLILHRYRDPKHSSRATGEATGLSHLELEPETTAVLEGNGFGRARKNIPQGLKPDSAPSVFLGTAEAVPFQNKIFHIVKCIDLGRITALALMAAVCLLAAPAQATTTYTVTKATDANATDTTTGDAVKGIYGLGKGTQDTNDATGNSGDLRWVVNRAIIYGGTVKIVFDATAVGCSSLPCVITLSGPLPPIASLYNVSNDSSAGYQCACLIRHGHGERKNGGAESDHRRREQIPHLLHLQRHGGTEEPDSAKRLCQRRQRRAAAWAAAAARHWDRRSLSTRAR